MLNNIINLNKELQIIDLGLYLRDHNALVISDVHIGYEEALNKQGILIPRLQFQQVMKRIENLISQALKKNKQTSFDLIIINGDLKHEFGTISDTEWRQTLKFIDFLATKTKKIILIKGNHDTILEPIAKKRNIEIVDEYVLGNSKKDCEYYFCHGNIVPKTSAFKKAKTIIIGHEHPAIALREDARVEKFKCFLFGKYKESNNTLTKRYSLKNMIKNNAAKNLIVLPSFNPITEGTDILKENLLSPFLHQNLNDFEVYVVPDEERVLYFKKIKDIANLL